MKHNEKRAHPRFSVMKNVAEPVDLKLVSHQKILEIPGFIMNLSAGGMRMMSIGDEAREVPIGSTFIMDIHLPEIDSFSVEGRVVSIQEGAKAKLHHEHGEWFIGLSFTKINAKDAKRISQIAEDWEVCETKIGMGLPDICFQECRCFSFCEKGVKLSLK